MEAAQLTGVFLFLPLSSSPPFPHFIHCISISLLQLVSQMAIEVKGVLSTSIHCYHTFISSALSNCLLVLEDVMLSLTEEI